jgi:hypothetical protein
MTSTAISLKSYKSIKKQIDQIKTEKEQPSLFFNSKTHIYFAIHYCGPLHGERVAMPKGIDGCGLTNQFQNLHLIIALSVGEGGLAKPRRVWLK